MMRFPIILFAFFFLISEVESNPRVALVLSGGGARGGAHIGVLRAFERAGVFNQAQTPMRFNEQIHGFGIGLYLDRRLSGPLRLEVVGTNRRDFNVYTSIGYAF